MDKHKLLKSIAGTGFIFGLAGWFYIAENAVFHPNTLHLPLTHLLPYPREDTFGAMCFGISLVCCFVYLMVRD